LFVIGYSLAEAVSCGTRSGASLLDLKNLVALEKGKSATFLAVKGGPSNLPDNLEEVESFYICGAMYEA
jgi:imidazolonepropionase-like amidohydrolase